MEHGTNRTMIDLLFVVGLATGLALLMWKALELFRTEPLGGWRRATGITLSILFAAVVALPMAWSIARSRTFQLMGDLVRRVDTEERIVALTFDDGPTVDGGTAILDVLQEEGVRASFYLTGAEIEANPQIARRMVVEGHELGNHTYSHQRMLGRSLATIEDELERTDAAIRQVGHDGRVHFRAPFSHKLLALPYYLARTDRTSISYDIEPESNPEIGASAERIVEDVTSRVRPGSIILLHVMYPSRAESLAAVPEIIRRLRADGYEFVTVSELIDRGG